MNNAGRRHLLIALAASASGGAFGSDRIVRGSGRIGSERRAAAGFARVSVAGPFEVEIRQAGKASS